MSVYDVEKLLEASIRAFGGNKTDFTNFDYSGVKFQFKDIQYENADESKSSSTLYSTSFLNDSGTTDSQIFKKVVSKQASFTWSFKEGVKLGAKSTTTVDVEVAKEGVELSAELNFESTQAQTNSTTQTWEVDNTINIPPFSLVEAKIVVDEVMSANVPCRANCTLSGFVDTTWVTDGKTHNAKAVVAQMLFHHSPTSLPDAKLTEASSGDPFSAVLNFTLNGTFTDSFGLSVRVEKHSTSIKSSENSLVESTALWHVPIKELAEN